MLEFDLETWSEEILAAPATEEHTEAVDTIISKAYDMSKYEIEQEQNDDNDPILQSWQEAAGSVKPVRGSAAGNKFYKKLNTDPKFRQAYLANSTPDAKRLWRQGFFSKELIVQESLRSSSKSFRQVDETRRKMMTFGSLVQALGG